MATTRGKAICFIDNANIFHGQAQAGWRIDWQKFINRLGRDGEIWQTYFFASYQEPMRPEESAFYQFLKEQLRWEVQLYPLGLKTIHCGNCNHVEKLPAEKGVDVGIAVKMLMLAMTQAYETAILVSGDRDYLETVKYIKGLGLRVEVVAWREGLSDDLSSESSAPVLHLSNLRDHIEKTD
jgi:uncharacterized LabA/DUF88 family protein